MSENMPTESPKPREFDFIEQTDQWLRTLPPDDYYKFMSGVSLDTVLVLFKYFPNNALVKEVLQGKI